MAAQNTAPTSAPPTSDNSSSPTARQWLALSVLVLSQLAVWLDNTVLNVALKTLSDPNRGLDANPSQLEWCISSYTLVFAVLLFTGGVLADRYGHRRLLLLGMLVFGASSTWAAYSHSANELIVARGAMGIGSALIMPATLALIAQIFDERHRATAIAIWSGSSGIAIATGPMLSGALLDHFWWGSVFLVNVPIVVLCIIGSFVYLPGVVDRVKKKFDPIGVLLSTVGLFAIVWGIIEGGHRNRFTDRSILTALIGGLVLVGVFILVELKVSNPSFDVRLFKNVRFTGASVAVMLTFFGLNGSMYYTSFYLQGVHGQSPLTCGLCIAPVAIGVLFGAPVSAKLVARSSVRVVVTIAMLIAAVGFSGYVLLGAKTGLWEFWGFLILQGLGMGAAVAPTTEAIMAVLPADRTGAGSAVNNSMRQIGGVMGVAVLGSVLTTVYRNRITPQVKGLPKSAADTAEQSAENTRLVAGKLHMPHLVDLANQNFDHAMHVASVVGTALSLVGALVIFGTFRRPYLGRHAADGTNQHHTAQVTAQPQPAAGYPQQPPAYPQAAGHPQHAQDQPQQAPAQQAGEHQQAQPQQAGGQHGQQAPAHHQQAPDPRQAGYAQQPPAQQAAGQPQQTPGQHAAPGHAPQAGPPPQPGHAPQAPGHQGQGRYQ